MSVCRPLPVAGKPATAGIRNIPRDRDELRRMRSPPELRDRGILRAIRATPIQSCPLPENIPEAPRTVPACEEPRRAPPGKHEKHAHDQYFAPDGYYGNGGTG